MKMNDITIDINVQVQRFFSLIQNTAMRFIFVIFLNDYGE